MAEMTVSKCRFCELAERPADNAVDVPWLTDSDYFAGASIGALIEGWSLICPKDHVLNLKHHYQSDGFWRFATQAIDLVSNRYGGPVALFEHGATCEDSQTSCGTAHAHMHVVPFVANLSDLAVNHDSSLTWLECSVEQIAELSEGQEYLFVVSEGMSRDSRGMLAKLPKGQSQFFRKVIADWLGRAAEYSYKTHPQVDVSTRSAEVLREQAESVRLQSFANAA